jgi:hypothetical protein
MGAQAELIDRLPTIDHLRQLVTVEDIDWLLPLLDHKDDRLAGLAASMLRLQRNDPRVRQKYEKTWQRDSVYLKGRVMWRMLDYDDLASEWHERFRLFVVNNWSEFVAFNREFYGSGDDGFGRFLHRLNDNSYAKEKRWIYMFSIPVLVEGRQGAESLIEETVKRFPYLASHQDMLLRHMATV